ncbi:trimethyllysine dioxygenase, mitochondrial [Galleria mellonella]|uniref:Trimethyllysine dioxygenase, mitochondrial n=1 Tax=Galleria mellonella TaxID=7137 RepID=A0ABM3MKF1_GALME|nr:trimethyllysine dioxygenase, mitochondrial [Galleria mellonella]
MAAIREAKIIDRAIEIQLEKANSIRFEDCWLRDHCRCTSCYHADTFQRAKHILDIPDSKIVSLKYNENQVIITWDDGHTSIFEADFLAQFDYKKWNDGRKLKPVLWHGDEVATKITRIHVDKFLNTKDGARSVFQSLLDYGVALIEEVNATLEDTEVVCKALGGVQHTIFGGMWQFTTRADHADTAYTNIPLALHNDSTYFTESTGLQILHCLEHSNGEGGDTILVDGFYGATRLRHEFPEDYAFLTKFNIEAEYIEEGHHHKFSSPVIKIDAKTNDPAQIRYNVYDRSPMAFTSSEDCRAYYRSLRNLGRYYEDTKNQWQFKLWPGTVMVMDNFRVLHGRTGFTGTRVLAGSYVSRSDWLDRARVLGLIQ